MGFSAKSPLTSTWRSWSLNLLLTPRHPPNIAYPTYLFTTNFLVLSSIYHFFWLVNSTIKWCQNHRLQSPDPLMDILGMVLGFTMWTSPPSPPVPSINLWMLPHPQKGISTVPTQTFPTTLQHFHPPLPSTFISIKWLINPLQSHSISI